MPLIFSGYLSQNKTKTMKNLINIKAIALLGVMFAFSASAQDKPQFCTDNGTKVVTEMDCASLKDLSVKVPITSSMFKYDAVDLNAEINMNPGGNNADDIYAYTLSILQKKFSIQYEGKKEIMAWLVNPNGGFGDLAGSDGNIRQGVFCGSTSKEEVSVHFTVYGYIKTGDKEWYNEKGGTWEKIPTYDEGTLLGEVTMKVKQTAENVAAAKKNKTKKRFGM
jgi:hypothetical protein